MGNHWDPMLNFKSNVMRIHKIFLSSFLLALGFAGTAQNTSKVSFGLRGGFDYRNINGKNQNGDDLNFKMVPRFNGGLVVEIPVAKDFFIQPSLLYATKGGKTEDNFFGSTISAEYNLGYLELPVNFVYKPQLGNGNMLLGFGPYVAYGITGNIKYALDGTSRTDDIEYTKDYSDENSLNGKYIKPFDYGGNILFGYQFARGFSAQLNAQLGMAQIKADNNLDTDSQVKFKNTGFGISLGYMF